MRHKEGCQTRNFLIGSRVGREAEVDDSRMGMSLAKDQITEVPIVGDENSTFGNRDGQDFLIGQTRRMILANSGGIVPLAHEECPDSRLGALVEQEPHRPA